MTNTLQPNPVLKVQRWHRVLTVVGIDGSNVEYEGRSGYTWKSEAWGVVVTHRDSGFKVTLPWHVIRSVTDETDFTSSDEDAHVNDVDPS